MSHCSATIFNTTLNITGESRNFSDVSDLRGKTFSFFTTEYDVSFEF